MKTELLLRSLAIDEFFGRGLYFVAEVGKVNWTDDGEYQLSCHLLINWNI